MGSRSAFRSESDGKLRYEASHGDRRSPDVTFQLPGQDLSSFIIESMTVEHQEDKDDGFLTFKLQAIGS